MPFGVQVNPEDSLYQSEHDPLNKQTDTVKEPTNDDFYKISSTASLQDHDSAELVEYDGFVCSTTEDYKNKCKRDVRDCLVSLDLGNVVNNLWELAFVYCLIYGLAVADPIEEIQQSIEIEEIEEAKPKEEEVLEEDEPEPASEEVEYEMDTQDQHEHFNLNDEQMGVVAIVEENAEGCTVKSPDGILRHVSEDSLEVIHNEAELLNNAQTNGLTNEEFEFICDGANEGVGFAVHDKALDATSVPELIEPEEDMVGHGCGEKLVQVLAVSQDQDLNLVQHGSDLFAVAACDLMPMSNEEVYPMLNDEAGRLTPEETEMVYEADERAHFAVLYYTLKTWHFEPPAETLWFHIASDGDPVEVFSDSDDCTSVGSGMIQTSDLGEGFAKIVVKPVASNGRWEKFEARDGTEKWFSKSMMPPPFDMDQSDITEFRLHSDDTAFIFEDDRRIHLLDCMTWQEGEVGVGGNDNRRSFAKQFPDQTPTLVDL